MAYFHRYSALIFFLAVTTSGAVIAETFSEKWKKKGRTIENREISWTTVFEDDFDKGNLNAVWKPCEGKWAIENGKLKSLSGTSNRTILLDVPVTDTMKIEFDAVPIKHDKSVCDISVLVFVDPEADKPTFDGYLLSAGGFWNSMSQFIKRRQWLAKTEAFVLTPGEKHHVNVVVDSGHIRYWVGDQIILECWDPQPIAPEKNHVLGLRTFDTEVHFDNVVISHGRPKQ